MIKSYAYKMQWYFTTYSESVKNCKKVIRAIGAKSLTIIYFKDEKGREISSYSGMVQYPFGLCDDETCKHIDKVLRTQKNVVGIELIRR